MVNSDRMPVDNIDQARAYTKSITADVEHHIKSRIGGCNVKLADLSALSANLKIVVNKFEEITKNETPFDSSGVMDFRNTYTKFISLIKEEEKYYKNSGWFNRFIESIAGLIANWLSKGGYKNPLELIKELNKNFSEKLDTYEVKLNEKAEAQARNLADKAEKAEKAKAKKDKWAKNIFKESQIEFKRAETFLSKVKIKIPDIQSVINQRRPIKDDLHSILEKLELVAKEGNVIHLYPPCKYDSLPDAGRNLLEQLNPAKYPEEDSKRFAAALREIIKPIVGVVNARIEQERPKPAKGSSYSERVRQSSVKRPAPPAIFPFDQKRDNGKDILPTEDAIMADRKIFEDAIKADLRKELQEQQMPLNDKELEDALENKLKEVFDGSLKEVFNNLLSACKSNDARKFYSLKEDNPGIVEIKKAGRLISREIHPDKHAGQPTEKYAKWLFQVVSDVMGPINEKITEREREEARSKGTLEDRVAEARDQYENYG